LAKILKNTLEYTPNYESNSHGHNYILAGCNNIFYLYPFKLFVYWAPNIRLLINTVMRRNYLNLLIFAFGAGSLLLLSCHHDNAPVTATLPAGDSLANAKKANLAAEQDSETFLLPSPLQIASIFKNAGLTYYPGLTSQVKDAGQYNNTYDRSLNMGIYSADLSYCVLNKQTQDALDYLKIVKTLADKLGFGNVFESNSLLKRFQTNMGSTDSLATVIADLQMETDSYLEANKQKYVGVIAFTGAWIESMYVGSKVYEKGKSSNVSSRISEQMNILDNLIKLLTKYQAADPHMKDLIGQLQSVQNTYSAYSEVKNYNPDSDQPISLTPDHIAQVSNLVQDLRNKFIAS
jgi:hypothetical protein